MKEKPQVPEKSINPLFDFIKNHEKMGSPRELIVYAIQKIEPHDLPEDPEEIKKILNEAVDLAVSVQEKK